jgi:hypothetical protein
LQRQTAVQLLCTSWKKKKEFYVSGLLTVKEASWANSLEGMLVYHLVSTKTILWHKSLGSSYEYFAGFYTDAN